MPSAIVLEDLTKSANTVPHPRFFGGLLSQRVSQEEWTN